jgi:AcrR family transcriptional regulator
LEGRSLAVAERVMRADARRNRERIMVAARDAFAENGMDATLDDIARRAAVGPGTLYRHFPDRETLLAAVYRDEILALCARTDELAETLPADEALAAWLRLQLDYITAKRGLGAAVKTMLGIESETVNFCKDAMRAAVGRLLSRAQEAGAVRMDIAPADLLRLVHGVGAASETDPSSAERLLSYVLDGIRPQPPRAPAR